MRELAEILSNPDGSGMATDPATRELLQQMSETLNELYATGVEADDQPSGTSAMESAEGGEYEDEYDEEPDSPEVEMPRRPWPADLWRAAHEVDDDDREPKKLTQEEWDALVARLNESAKRKMHVLGIMQRKRIADELAGARFSPHITRRSRELAAHNKRLPERVEALMRRRKAKLDKVREEKAQRELAEATFRPNLNKPSRSRMGEMGERMRRRVGHLLQYDVDKRIRAAQRRQIMQEVEDRELTFSPQINPRSDKLVRRMQLRRQRAEEKAEAGAALTEEEEAALAGGLTERARSRRQAEIMASALEAAEREIFLGRVRRLPLGSRGLTILPGHEEETFHPRINDRSRALTLRHGGPAHERLYETATASIEARRATLGAYTRQFINTSVDVEGGIDMGKAFRADLERTVRGAERVDPRSPGYINMVEYKPRYDFLVRRVLNDIGEGSASEGEGEQG